MKQILPIALASLLAACSGESGNKEGKTEAAINPQSKEVDGYLGDYLEVADGSYKAEKDNQMIFNWVVKVKVIAKDVYDNNDDYGLKDGNYGPLFLDLCDNSGAPITGFENFHSEFSDDAKLADILKKGSGETWVTFTKMHEYGTESYPDGVSNFLISSKEIEKRDEKNASGDSETQKNEQSDEKSGDNLQGSGEDLDKLIDEYEKYAGEYVKLVEKNPNDLNIMGSKAYKKVLSLGTKLATAQASMSGDQSARFTEIQSELLKKAQEIEKK